MPSMPRPVNTPIGATGGKPINTGRLKAQPAPVQTQHDYIAHMIAADKAFGAKATPAPVRGSSGGLAGMLAKGKPPVGVGGKQREGTIMGNVDKMAR
jgi:hypothetical protein